MKKLILINIRGNGMMILRKDLTVRITHRQTKDWEGRRDHPKVHTYKSEACCTREDESNELTRFLMPQLSDLALSEGRCGGAEGWKGGVSICIEWDERDGSEMEDESLLQGWSGQSYHLKLVNIFIYLISLFFCFLLLVPITVFN